MSTTQKIEHWQQILAESISQTNSDTKLPELTENIETTTASSTKKKRNRSEEAIQKRKEQKKNKFNK